MSLSRRSFLKTSGGLSFVFTLAPYRVGIAADDNKINADPAGSQQSPYAWVHIAADGKITIQAPADEMGQGAMTALPIILAEELDADWNDVVIEFSPADDEIYGNPNLAGLVLTVASWAVSSYFDRLRMNGAQMRRILLDNVAREWHVPLSELHTEASQVVHAHSQRRISYADIVTFARLPHTPPQISANELKKPAQFRLIGSRLPRRDIVAKSTGAALYSIDMRLPDMLYACVIRPALRGAQVCNFNAPEPADKQGLLKIINLQDRIAVVADSFTHALKVKNSISVEWDRVSDFDSEQAMLERAQQVQNTNLSGFPWQAEGDTDTAFNKAISIVSAEYKSDYVYHAQLEPLNGVAWYKGDGEIEVWAGTQAPSHCLRAVATAIATTPEKVKLHRMYSGGAYGRRGAADHDYVIDAAILSKQLGKPVKLIWSREDDLRLARLKPMSAQYLRAAIDGEGKLQGWHHRVASEESLTQGDPQRYVKWGKIPITGIYGAEQSIYRIPNRMAEHILQHSNVRISPLRGVGVTPNKFAGESFLDEVAEAMHIDPLALRLQLVADNTRARRVLETIAEMADWHRPRSQTALGLAFTSYDESLLACIAELAVDPTTADIKVHKLWSVVDPGLLIQPDNAEAQIQGGLLFGLSNALKEGVSIKNGEIQHSNYHDYPILTASEVPDVEVRIIQGSTRPSAIGEVGVLLPTPAIANAFARLTGKRLRHMPFTADRVRAALEA